VVAIWILFLQWEGGGEEVESKFPLLINLVEENWSINASPLFDKTDFVIFVVI